MASRVHTEYLRLDTQLTVSLGICGVAGSVNARVSGMSQSIYNLFTTQEERPKRLLANCGSLAENSRYSVPLYIHSTELSAGMEDMVGNYIMFFNGTSQASISRNSI
ncbi:uncharacterized protein MCYG_02591 [Microsporum canis CBS 113480]|uniref:Uncharacterized protein n=1 Tax=Arthroderma otae (strain ATCC MYA-4605 / CBS 113480) TaxID=554155 RepID=C5FG87_ARTOC|nr:uncharacterized protein MCYG_02591 [Microsporum canis CBS 113480]EEQ29772.1 predicted protein [Microsporum canis CBS 113480]